MTKRPSSRKRNEWNKTVNEAVEAKAAGATKREWVNEKVKSSRSVCGNERVRVAADMVWA